MAPLYRYALSWLFLVGFAFCDSPSPACARAWLQSDADWGEDQYAIAAQHYRQQRWQQAIGQFRLLLDREPTHARASMANFFLAESHVQLEQYEPSLDYFQAFLQQEPKHTLTPRAQFRLGEAYYLLGRDDPSIAQLSELLAADQDGPFTEFTLAYLGEMLLKRESSDSVQQAHDYLQQVVRDFPDSSMRHRSQLGLAQAHQKQGRTSEAEQLLSELQTCPEPTVAEEATLILAGLWIERGEGDKVLASLSDDALNRLSTPQQPKAKYWRGRAEMAAKNWAEAARFISQSAPELTDLRLQQAAWYDAAICFWQAGDLAQAERLLQQSTEQWPAGEWAAESLFLLVQAAARQQRGDAIATHAETFLRQFPDHALAGKVRETLGRVALDQRDHTQSVAHFQSLLAKTEATATNSLERATWYHLLALAQIGLDNLDQGLESLEACLQLLPAFAPRDSSESLDAWLQKHANAPSPSGDPSAGELLREQAAFARASVLVRQKKWPAALEAQAQVLWEHPRSSFRNELWADRLRTLLALQDWTQWALAAQTARQWLRLGEENGASDTPDDLSASETVLLTALAATALSTAEHWYDRRDFAQAIVWYDVAALGAEETIVEQALSGLAWAEFQSRPAEESEATVRLLLDRFSTSPRSAEAGLKLAEQQFRDGRYAAAEELLQTLLSRFPTWPRRHQLHALQAKLLARRADSRAKEQAIDALNAALSAVAPTSADTAERQVQKQLATAAYLYDLGWLQHDLGQTELANQAFEKININHPTSRYWADATFRLAQEHFAQGRLASANDLVQQLWSTIADATATEPPRSSAGVPALSASFSNPDLGSDSGAASSTTALVSGELQCHTLYLRTMIGVAEKDWPAVATWAERLVEQFPNHRLRWLSQFWWGEALFRQRRFGESIERLSEVLPRTDDQAEPWVAMTHLRLAQALGHLDRWSEVLTIAEPARRRFADFSQAYELDYLIGRALATEARFPQARAAYQQVIDSPTGKPTETAAMAQWMIGETYFHQEQYALAADAYHRTETLHRFPQWQAAALLQAGKCYEHLGRPQDAIGVYRQLLKEHPHCTLVQQAEERLTKLSPQRPPKLVPANPLPPNRLRGT